MLESDRFLIKKLEVRDVNLNYLSWLNNPVTNEFLMAGKNKRSMKLIELEEYVKEKTSDPKIYFYGIFLKNTLEHIGNIKYEIEPQSEKYFMGILIGNQDWLGKGVAIEVISRTKNFDSTIKALYLVVSKANLNAIKAYAKCGFVQDNSLKFENKDNKSMVMRLNV
jgi:ribosomal-protein-alanine N-acetyltransferase